MKESACAGKNSVITCLNPVLLRAVAIGELAAGEASALSTLAPTHGKALELVEIDRRIRALEERNG